MPQVITAIIGDETTPSSKDESRMDIEEDAEEARKEIELNVRNRHLLAKIINARNVNQQTALIRATHTHSFASYRNDRLLSRFFEIEGIDVTARDAKGNTGSFT